MSREALSRKTVSQLRDLCRQKGLPVYQSAGYRLLKADLVDQLTRRKRKPAAERKAAPKRRPRKVASPAAAATIPPALPVTAAELEALPFWRLLAMAKGVDRHFDPSASTRELVSFLVASERPLSRLEAEQRKQANETSTRNVSGEGWVDGGRSLGVRLA